MSKRNFIIALSYFRRKKLQGVLLIFLISMTIVLSSTAFILLNSKESVETIFDNQNASKNLVLSKNEKSYVDEMTKYIKNQNEIKEVLVKDYFLPESDDIFINNEKLEVDSIYQSFDSNTTKNKITIIENNNNNTEPMDNEIFIPSSLAYTEAIEIGDTYSFYKDTELLEFKVAAIILDAHYSSGMEPIRMYISIKEYTKLSRSGSAIHIFYKNYTTLTEFDFIQKIHKKYDRTFKGEIFDFNEFKSEYLGISEVLAVIFIFIAVIILFISIIAIANAINISIDEEYISIGILKSCGFSSNDISFIYLIRYFILSIISVPIGLLIMIFVKNLLINNLTNLFSNLNTGVYGVIPLIITISIIVFLVVFFTMIFSLKAIKIKPVEAIKYKNIQTKSRKNNVNVTKKSIFTVEMLLSIKDILTFKTRSIFFILMLGICVFVSVITINSNETFLRETTIKGLAGISDYDLELINRYKSKEITEKTIVEKLTKNIGQNKINLVYTRKSVPTSTIYRKDIDRNVPISGTAYSDFKDINYPFLFGEAPINNNEIAFDTSTAKILNKQIGDYVEITIEGIKKHMLITALYQSFDSFTYHILEAAIPENIIRHEKNYRPRIYLLLNDKNDKDLAYNILKDEFKNNVIVNKISKAEKSFTKKSDKIALSLLIISIIIIFTSIIIVINRILLEIRMNTKTIGIYKSFGFSNDRIRKIYLIKILILSSISCISGTIISLLLSSIFINGILRIKTSVYELEILPNYEKLVFLNLIFILSIGLATYISSNKIKKVSVRNLVID